MEYKRWSSTSSENDSHIEIEFSRNFRVTCNYKTNINSSTLISIGFTVPDGRPIDLYEPRFAVWCEQKIGWTLNHEDEGMRVAAVDVPAGISASGSSSHRRRRSEVPGWWSVVSSEIHRAHDTPHIASASITRAHTRQGATSTSVASPGGTAYSPSSLSLSLSRARSPSSFAPSRTVYQGPRYRDFESHAGRRSRSLRLAALRTPCGIHGTNSRESTILH